MLVWRHIEKDKVFVCVTMDPAHARNFPVCKAVVCVHTERTYGWRSTIIEFLTTRKLHKSHTTP